MKQNRVALATLGLLAVAAAWPAAGVAQTLSTKSKNTSAKASAQSTATAEQAEAQPGAEVLRDLAAWRPKQARSGLESQGAASSKVAPLRAAWGVLQGEEGSTNDALKTLDAAVALDPAAPAPLYEKGELLYRLERMSEAQAAWKASRQKAEALVAAHPDDARALYYLGAASVRMKDFDAARDALSKALAKGADPALVHYQVGLSWAFAGKWKEAVDELSRTIEIDSGFAHAYYYRGLCYNKLDQKDKMINDFSRFVALAPNAPEAAKVRAILAAVG